MVFLGVILFYKIYYIYLKKNSMLEIHDRQVSPKLLYTQWKIGPS